MRTIVFGPETTISRKLCLLHKYISMSNPGAQTLHGSGSMIPVDKPSKNFACAPILTVTKNLENLLGTTESRSRRQFRVASIDDAKA